MEQDHLRPIGVDGSPLAWAPLEQCFFNLTVRHKLPGNLIQVQTLMYVKSELSILHF